MTNYPGVYNFFRFERSLPFTVYRLFLERHRKPAQRAFTTFKFKACRGLEPIGRHAIRARFIEEMGRLNNLRLLDKGPLLDPLSSNFFLWEEGVGGWA